MFKLTDKQREQFFQEKDLVS